MSGAAHGSTYIIVEAVTLAPLQSLNHAAEPAVVLAQARRLDRRHQVVHGHVAFAVAVEGVVLPPSLLAAHREWESAPLLHLGRW
jgi:hypothetical protein